MSEFAWRTCSDRETYNALCVLYPWCQENLHDILNFEFWHLRLNSKYMQLMCMPILSSTQENTHTRICGNFNPKEMSKFMFYGRIEHCQLGSIWEVFNNLLNILPNIFVIFMRDAYCYIKIFASMKIFAYLRHISKGSFSTCSQNFELLL